MDTRLERNHLCIVDMMVTARLYFFGILGCSDDNDLGRLGRWSGNSVKEKGLFMDDGLDVGNGSEASGFVTSNMGRASYARAMNELKVDVDLRDTNVVVVPKFSGEGFTTSTIRVEYEWTHPRCSKCKTHGKLVLVDEHEKLLEMKVTNKASASKPSTSIGDQFIESHDDVVEFPNDENSRYMSSTSGGDLCEDDLDFYDGYEAMKFNSLTTI
uniref:Zinc knuckle CX2CX4HX4C n=1 Tax=Tanacetum cinerariifolium TaxID=118510 RepID=A0A6L2K4J5_TANCI|nr:hypothetical protein [Tanacetum cinerariifolium]